MTGKSPGWRRNHLALVKTHAELGNGDHGPISRIQVGLDQAIGRWRNQKNPYANGDRIRSECLVKAAKHIV
jgi:hypothetical protein